MLHAQDVMQSDHDLCNGLVQPRSKSSIFRFASSRCDYTMTDLLEPQWWLLPPILFLQFTGIALVIPALPNYKLHFFGSADRAARFQSFTDSSRAVLTTIVSGELGRVSDAVGRCPLILLSVICTLAPLISLALTESLYPYLLLFAISGALGGQNTPAVNAYVADCCPQKIRAKCFGMIGVVINFVFMVAPIFGGFFAQRYGLEQLFKLAVVLEIVAAFTVALLPESLPHELRQSFSLSHDVNFSFRKILEPLKDLVAMPNGSFLRRLATIRFIRGLAGSGVGTLLFFFLASQLGSFTDADFGALMAAFGFAGTCGQLIILRILLNCNCSERTVLLVSLCAVTVQVAAWTLLPLFPSKTLTFTVSLLSAGTAMMDPAFTALVTEGRQEDIGLMLGVFTSVDGLASLLGPLAFSLMFSFNHVFPFGIAAVLNASAAMLVFMMPCDENN